MCDTLHVIKLRLHSLHLSLEREHYLESCRLNLSLVIRQGEKKKVEITVCYVSTKIPVKQCLRFITSTITGIYICTQLTEIFLSLQGTMGTIATFAGHERQHRSSSDEHVFNSVSLFSTDLLWYPCW